MVKHHRLGGGWLGSLALGVAGVVFVNGKGHHSKPKPTVAPLATPAQDAKAALKVAQNDFVEIVKARMAERQAAKKDGEASSSEDNVKDLMELGDFLAKLQQEVGGDDPSPWGMPVDATEDASELEDVGRLGTVRATKEVGGVTEAAGGLVKQDADAVVDPISAETSTPLAKDGKKSAEEELALVLMTNPAEKKGKEKKKPKQQREVDDEDDADNNTTIPQTAASGAVPLCMEMNLTAAHAVVNEQPALLSLPLSLDDALANAAGTGEQVIEHLMILSGEPGNCVLSREEISKIKNSLSGALAAARLPSNDKSVDKKEKETKGKEKKGKEKKGKEKKGKGKKGKDKKDKEKKVDQEDDKEDDAVAKEAGVTTERRTRRVLTGKNLRVLVSKKQKEKERKGFGEILEEAFEKVNEMAEQQSTQEVDGELAEKNGKGVKTDGKEGKKEAKVDKAARGDDKKAKGDDVKVEGNPAADHWAEEMGAQNELSESDREQLAKELQQAEVELALVEEAAKLGLGAGSTPQSMDECTLFTWKRQEGGEAGEHIDMKCVDTLDEYDIEGIWELLDSTEFPIAPASVETTMSADVDPTLPANVSTAIGKE